MLKGLLNSKWSFITVNLAGVATVGWILTWPVPVQPNCIEEATKLNGEVASLEQKASDGSTPFIIPAPYPKNAYDSVFMECFVAEVTKLTGHTYNVTYGSEIPQEIFSINPSIQNDGKNWYVALRRK